MSVEMNDPLKKETWQKMVNGEWYSPAILGAFRLAAMDLCHEYNALRPSDGAGRTAKLKELIGNLGEEVCVEQPFHCDYGKNVTLGDRTFLNVGCVLLDCAPITFGKHVLCGPNCSFLTPIHPQDPAKRLTDMEMAKPITVGDNVWFGGNVTVLPGVTIGENTIVGAGSVVTKDLPANVLAVGNPARIVRQVPTPADKA